MTQGAYEGLLFCAQILIPSLFPFMVLSSFVVNCGISGILSRFLAPVTKSFFRLPGSAGVTILLSMFGGYPVGARGIRTLLDRGLITREEGARMLCFAVGAGPAFVIFAVGCSLLHDVTMGIILFAAQAVTQLILGFASRFLCKNDTYKQNTPDKVKPMPLASAFVQSCADGVLGMLNLCGMVVLFSSLMGILQSGGAQSMFENLLTGCGVSKAAATSILPILFEVTGGCNRAANAGASYELMAFAIGWGGLCVHFQVYSAVGELPVKRLLFTLFRVLQGALCAGITYGILLFYHPEPVADAFSNVQKSVSTASSSTIAGSIALIVMCFCFLFSYQRYQKKQKRII